MTAVGPTFVSVDCRLAALLDRVNGEGGLGSVAGRLTPALQKAIDRSGEAGALCRDGDEKGARQRLKQAIRALTQYRNFLRTRAARRRIDPAIRGQFADAGEPIRTDVRTLRGAASCPDDAPPA